MNHLSQNRKAIEAFSDLFAPTDVQVVEEKKTCPNCGKMILADSLYCPFCEHDQSQPAPLSPEQQPGFQFAVLEVFASLLLLDLGLPALFLLVLQPFGGHEIVAAAAGALWLGFKILLAMRVVEAQSPQGAPSFWKAAGLFLMSFLPIASWVAVGFASRKVALARAARYILPALAVMLLLLDLGFAANRIPISDGQRLLSSLSARPLLSSPPLTPERHFGSAVPTPTPAATCRSVQDVTLEDVGSTLCVRGVVRVGYGAGGNYYVSFGTGAADFYMVGYGWPDYPGSGVNPGDCLQVTGQIEQLGSAPVIVVEPPDLQERCP
ncbi:MAG: hypothetical protein ABSB61_03720 [Anaerolineales bacterium]